MARRPEDLGRIPGDPRWKPLAGKPGLSLWTDDYSNVLGVFHLP
jgi:hypothetical protein